MRIIKSVLIFFLCLFLFKAPVFAEQAISKQQEKRDPFIPLVSSEGLLLLDMQDDSKLSDLKVEGIIFDKSGQSYAVINGIVVKVADKIGDYEVLKIESQKVQLIKDANITELELKKED